MMLSASVIDYTVHDSIFVVAHFHCMVLVIGSALFAATIYWWPKVFGFMLDEKNSQLFYWTFVVASLLVFVPMFELGLAGVTRRLDYIYNPDLKPLLWVTEAGIFLYFVSLYYFVKMLIVSLIRREPAAADAWGTGRTTDWMTHSPVPFYNFAVTPQINSRDELAWRKANGLEDAQPTSFVPIHMPSNTAVPFILGMLALVWGFALVWRIDWLVDVSTLAMILAVIIRSFDPNKGYILSAEEIAKMEGNIATASVIAEQPRRAPAVAMEAH
jgi:cytochrome o ubiquinol oxidase subunit 1